MISSYFYNFTPLLLFFNHISSINPRRYDSGNTTPMPKIGLKEASRFNLMDETSGICYSEDLTIEAPRHRSIGEPSNMRLLLTFH